MAELSLDAISSRTRAPAMHDRLFDYALRRAGATEFFIRKVLAFVEPHGAELPGLSKREALKHLS